MNIQEAYRLDKISYKVLTGGGQGQEVQAPQGGADQAAKPGSL